MYKTLGASVAGIFSSLLLVAALEKQETLQTEIGSGDITVSYGQIVNIAIWAVLFAVTRGKGIIHSFSGAGLGASIAVIPYNWVQNYSAAGVTP